MGLILTTLKSWLQSLLHPSAAHNDVKVGQRLKIGGLVRTGRPAASGGFAFLEVDDGSSFQSLQAVVTSEVAEAVGGLGSLTPTGTSVLLRGELIKSKSKKQVVELKVSEVLLAGTCDNSAGGYPFAKVKTTAEFRRTQPHLRLRTRIDAATARVRNKLILLTELYFQGRGFMHLHAPTITTSDCEGAGEMFQVTTLLSQAERARAEETPLSDLDEDIAELEEEVSKQKRALAQIDQELEADKQDKELQKRQSKEKKKLLKVERHLHMLQAKADEQRRIVGGILFTPEGAVDHDPDFFHVPTFISISAQPHAEAAASALGDVFFLGSCCRAENSNTPRHLAEFIMLEPEMAFATLEDAMDLAEDFLQHLFRILSMKEHRGDLEFIARMVGKDTIERLRMMAATPFARCTYTHAIELLKEAVRGGKKFEFPVSWGIDLASEHERYLTEEVFKKPTMVYDYPKDIKAFYMRVNDDGKTVAGFDILVPGIGELIGGGQREERLDVLTERMQAAGMHLESYREYMDLRRFGPVPHSGFGLGFDRLVMFVAGLDNIRDTTPFPRFSGHAKF